MEITFSKYHGTGNDFIIINGLEKKLSRLFTKEKVELLCHRRFGIGADGLMILSPSKDADFFMDYFNSDGNRSSMCGNGGRCIVKYAFDQGVISNKCSFMAVDGIHEAIVVDHEKVSLGMNNVNNVDLYGKDFVLDTGSPHYVRIMDDWSSKSDIVAFGKEIRYSDEFKSVGINVNLVVDSGDFLDMKTYERGVEDETYSCGTGMIAAAISYHKRQGLKPGGKNTIINTKGGQTKVSYNAIADGSFDNIKLIGPAVRVFEGKLKL